jgi:uncharacterized caspase-like protein
MRKPTFWLAVLLIVAGGIFAPFPGEAGLQILDPDPDVGEVHALVVGIDEYPHLPKRVNLMGCVNDATGMAEALKPLCTSVEMLVNGQATRAAILSRFQLMLDKARPNDLIIFYCSSHGALGYNDFFLLPSDIKKNEMLSSGLSFATVTNAISSKEGIRSLIILDSCHSGGIGFDYTRYRGGAQGSMMVSCGPMEASGEKTRDGKTFGHFARYLIEGLGGKADEDQDGVITLRELFDYTYTNVKTISHNRQHPVMLGTLRDNLRLARLKK